MAELAIVGPNFFAYTEAIAGEFARRGLDVATFDEKRSNSVAAKVACRLGIHSRARLRRHLDQLAGRVIASGARDALLIGVEVLDRNFVARLAAAGLRVHLYMWDGQANKGRFREYLALLASAGTFDPRDAHELGMVYIPLFAEPVFDRSSEKCFDLAFCGTMHTGRVAAIRALRRSRLTLGLRLYYHSLLLFAFKGPRALGLLPLISTTPATKVEVAELFGSSRYVLDIPHPGQTGLTARTFEALLAGARLVTANPRALDLLPVNLRNRVAEFRTIDELERIVIAARPPLPPLTPDERYFLSLDRFVDDLAANMQAAAVRARAA